MAYINQKKNLKLLLIDPNGEVAVCYDGDIKEDEHYHALLHTIKTKFSRNKKLVKKAEKREGQNAELIHLMLDNDFVVMYDTTNYHNYRPYHDHTGSIMLPKAPKKLSRNQQIELLKLSKELPMNESGIEYDKNNHLPCVTYSLLQVAYRDKNKRIIDLKNIKNLVTELVDDKLEMQTEESLETVTHHTK